VNERKDDHLVAWVALLHLACCGGPLLILLLISLGATISVAGILGALPYIAGIGALLALGAVIFYFVRRCPTCGRRGMWPHGRHIHDQR
jgi:hypothetical protein